MELSCPAIWATFRNFTHLCIAARTQNIEFQIEFLTAFFTETLIREVYGVTGMTEQPVGKWTILGVTFGLSDCKPDQKEGNDRKDYNN